MRINKYLARCGFASRRKAEDLVIGGCVSVNGVITRDLATVINDTDRVEVHGKPVLATAINVYIAMNKPRGVVTTCDEQFGRKTVLEVLQEGNRINKDITDATRLFPVGRLDYDTEGLLFLTNDGDFARTITHPSSQTPKTYLAKIDKKLESSDLEKLQNGIEIQSTPDKTVTCRATTARFVGQYEVEITITEGKNRQVRKMFESIGARVLRLKRTAIGNKGCIFW